jgi:flavodoxin
LRVQPAPDIELPAIKLPELNDVKPDVKPDVHTNLIQDSIENATQILSEDSSLKGQESTADKQIEEIIDESYPENFDNQVNALVNNTNQTVYDEPFFEEAKQDLIEIFKNKGAKILSTVFHQSKISLNGNRLLIEVPTGYKNEQLDAEAYTLKHYFNVKLNGMNFELEFAEIKLVYKSEIPYSFDEKYKALLAENPQIALWFEKLSLMQY